MGGPRGHRSLRHYPSPPPLPEQLSPPLPPALHCCSGGLELLFGNQKEVGVDIPSTSGGETVGGC